MLSFNLVVKRIKKCGRGMMIRILISLSLLMPLTPQAQFTYVLDQSIPVEVDGNMLAMPWAGGLNSAQINRIDLNQDGKKDLVVFDRASNKLSTFLNQSNQYLYHPEYESLFPSGIAKWMLLRDYNCDGLEDIFVPNSNGIAVYKNTTQPGGNLSWEKLKFYAAPSPLAPPGTPGVFTEIILTQGFSKTNIFPGTNDIPTITDMDGDGDLDIINMRFVSPGTAEYHKNMSIENYGKCDSLEFVRTTQRWGDWEECSCNNFAFGQTCAQSGGKTNHNVGKAVLAIDTDGDGNKDLLFSEEDCPSLFLLRNEGSTEVADMNSAVPFPLSKPVFMPSFPAAFYEDVDFDGVPDLIASPARYARTSLNNSFRKSIWFYKNTGTAQNPNFTFVKDNFLQEGMIEVGDYAFPAFTDYDGDGDQDLFIGNYGNEDFRGVIAFYENVGTPESASFKLVTQDYLQLSLLSRYNMKPQFIDIDSDGNMDLTFLLSEAMNFNVGTTENILLEDVDQDGIVDLLVGTATGALEYWRNAGPKGSFNFALENAAFMNLGSSLTRTNINASVADMDNDGRQDLIIGDQSGRLTIYGDYRGTINSPQPATHLIYDSFSESYFDKNLGARIKPVAINLFNSNKPAIALGTVSGGMLILKNDGGEQLPAEPAITLFPNPLIPNEHLSILTDRNMLMELFTIMGQRISDPIFIGANSARSLEIKGLAPGIYIARFTFAGQSYGRKFIIL